MSRPRLAGTGYGDSLSRCYSGLGTRYSVRQKRKGVPLSAPFSPLSFTAFTTTRSNQTDLAMTTSGMSTAATTRMPTTASARVATAATG